MRILLLAPPYFLNPATYYPVTDIKTVKPSLPYSILTLGSFLKSQGLKVKVVPLQTFFIKNKENI